MAELIVYEYPLSERIRTFLRLEQLAQQLETKSAATTSLASRTSIQHLLDMLNVVARMDIKSEILKELDRIGLSLARQGDAAQTTSKRDEQTLGDIDTYKQQLLSIGAKVEYQLIHNEFLSSIRQRSTLPGGTCGFDLPAFHYWLNRSKEDRKNDLAMWYAILQPFVDALRFTLDLMRKSIELEEIEVENGFYQRGFDSQPGGGCQLLRIGLAKDQSVIPEISGNRQRLSIRFVRLTPEWRTSYVQEPLSFAIGLCQI